jgi:hypothetical protein
MGFFMGMTVQVAFNPPWGQVFCLDALRSVNEARTGGTQKCDWITRV